MEINNEQKKIVEALIFLSGGEISRTNISKKINIKNDILEKIIVDLKNDYQDRGICLSDNGNYIGFYTNQSISDKLKEIKKEETDGPLSKRVRETLTTIAYCGPLKKIDIDFIRGVNTHFILKQLVLRGLVSKTDSKTSLYMVTLDFLSSIGIDSVEKLPNYAQTRYKMQESLEEIKKMHQ